MNPEEQRSKIRDRLELKVLKPPVIELLELEGTPQDIVDFRRKIVPKLCFHACQPVVKKWTLARVSTWI